MDKRQAEYLRTQNDHGLKIGGFVKVLRRAWSHQFGWNAEWQKGMSAHIGKIYEIEWIQGADGVMLRGTNLWFPHFVLQEVDVVVIKDVDSGEVSWASLTDEEREKIRQRMSGVNPVMRGSRLKVFSPQEYIDSGRLNKLDHEYDLPRYSMMRSMGDRHDRKFDHRLDAMQYSAWIDGQWIEFSNWIDRAVDRIERVLGG